MLNQSNKSKSVQDAIDQLAEHQQRLIEFYSRSSTDAKQIDSVVDVLSIMAVPSSFGGPARTVETLEDLISVACGDYRGTEGQFRQHILPLISNFVVLYLESISPDSSFTDELYVADTLKSLLEEGNSYKIGQFVDKHISFFQIPIKEAGDLFKANLEKLEKNQSDDALRSLRVRIDNYVNKNYSDPNEREDMKRFLMAQWYEKPKATIVGQMREVFEATGAKTDTQQVIDDTNRDQDKRKFTIKQLNAINEIYGQSLNRLPAETPMQELVSSARNALKVDIAGIIGNADRVFNTTPGSTDTEQRIEQNKEILLAEHPNIKSQLIAKVGVIVEVKTQAGFWHGLKGFLHKLEAPFKKWLEKKEAKLQAKEDEKRKGMTNN